MSIEIEEPVTSETARKFLKVGETKFSAMKRALGVSGARSIFLSQFVELMKAQPNFALTQFYAKSKRQHKRQGLRGANGRKLCVQG